MSEPLQCVPALSRAQASRDIKSVDNTQDVQRIEIRYVIVQRAAAQHMHRVFDWFATNVAIISNEVSARQDSAQRGMPCKQEAYSQVKTHLWHAEHEPNIVYKPIGCATILRSIPAYLPFLHAVFFNDDLSQDPARMMSAMFSSRVRARPVFTM